MRWLMVVLMLGLPAFADFPQPYVQLSLKEGMTMAEVTKLIGVPDATESGTCGTKTKKPWPCRTWRYKGDWRGELRFFSVLFERSGEEWVVNSWSST